MIKQTLSLIGAQIIGRLAGFALLIALGSTLGSEMLGAFGTMETILMISTIISTFGMDLWLARYVANDALDPSGFWKLVGSKLLLSILVLAIYGVLFSNGMVGTSLWEFRWALGYILFSLFFDHVGYTAQSVLEGRRQLLRIAVLILLRWGIFCLLGLWVLFTNPDFELFCLSFLGGSVVRAIASLFLVRDQLEKRTISLPLGHALLESAPMALLNTMVGVYFHIDMLMIPEMDSLQGAGFYKMAYTMVQALLFLSGAVASSLYPIFSNRNLAFRIKWEHFSRGTYLLMLLAFPIAFCTPFVSEWMIEIMFAHADKAVEFLPSARALDILVWALPAMFINSSLVRLFLGMHRQKEALIGVSLTAVVNISLNIVLIPKIGFYGAAVSTVVSETVLTLFLYISLIRGGQSITIWTPVLKPLVLSTQPLFLAWLVSSWAPAFLIPLVVVSFAMFLYLGQFVSLQDFKRFGVIEE